MNPDLPFGERLKRLRNREGMSRPVLAGLVGRSAEWLKRLEKGDYLMPRPSMLFALADRLGVELVELIGDPRIAGTHYGKIAHDRLPDIARALASYPISTEPGPVDVAGLVAKVGQLWDLWHGSARHRTAVAGLLPSLLHDVRTAVPRVDDRDRRTMLATEAQTYHLVQLFLSFQPAPELVHLCGDRAMTAAQGTDDPLAMSAAAWYMNHVFRDAGQQHEARVQLALDTAGLLNPERSDDERAFWGLLRLACALSFAKVGRDGDAWRYWDDADRAAKALPGGYEHPWLRFGRSMVDAYAVTMLVDLMRPHEAIRQADRLDLDGMTSQTRRSFHTIETARAYHQAREHVAAVHLLARAQQISPETVRFNLFTRAAIKDLSEHGGHTVRADAQGLGRHLDLV
ncbi:helix-turn-helix domain-containing protein [Saccharopolyspora phatthalungensis]|uniref:Transcriptional regulator with XRE-family HTH domain n=1 Tax=Saccharopolyspora phatthalungensis TaxID=664693 RepID=A0A840Q8G8_9PSEU|nr:helix-turn-helix domain-containing protein [Saccharopolyspora phatthalungensis]MBB5158822.1 transcriptional regulator with XRE-family HTH domain [Saccharopolyspora phatthalungensis]